MRSLNKKQRDLLDEWFEENKNDVGFSWDPQEGLPFSFFCKIVKLNNFETIYQAITSYVQGKISNLMDKEENKMGKDMTFWLFIGMFQGVISETKVFRKEEQAILAFYEYTEIDWAKLHSNEQAYEEFDCGDYSGSQILELQIEP